MPQLSALLTMDDLKKSAQDFRSAWLNTQANYAALDEAGKVKFKIEYSALETRAKSIVSKLNAVGDAYDTASSGIDKIINFFKPATENKTISAGVNGLGLLQFAVPVAVISVSVATMSYFVADAVSLVQRMKIFEGLVEQKGLSPEEAAGIVDKLAGDKSLLGGSPLGQLTTYAGIGLLTFGGYKLYQIFKQKKAA